MPTDQRKRKGSGKLPNRRNKAQRRPELPRALVKELGCAVAQAPKMDTDKKGNVASVRSSFKKPRLQDRLDKSCIPGTIEAEIQMQSTLAKKLKLKKGQSRTGPNDGLDGLLAGFEDLNGTVPVGMPSMARAASEELSFDSDDPGFIDLGESGTGIVEDADDASDRSGISEGTSGTGDECKSQSTCDESAEEGASGDTGSVLKRQDDVQQKAQRAADVRPLGEKYIPPALRGTVESAEHKDVHSIGISEQAAAQRQIRKLFNRVAASNLTGVSADISALFGSMPRHLVIETIVQALMQALEEGPRAADQFAAVMACLVVMVSALSNEQELLAKVMLALAHGLEKSRSGGNSIASSNTARVVCCLYLCKGIGSKVIYSLLEHLEKEFSDSDVHLILLVLQTVGYQLRGDDAAGMKAFIESVHEKSSELKSTNSLSQRARLMLELIVDIKNNRKRKNMGSHVGLEATVPAATLKQLRDCNADAMALHYITWPQLCATDHRGAWWLPHASDVSGQGKDEARPLAAVSSHPESSALLQLASKQRMNTDSRRAIFCVLMSAEDNMDAVERLMRLPLKGTAARDIAHVLLHCCLQEERWNPFYAHVATQLISHGKVYKTSMQFAIQDRVRRVPELNARQATNLASLLAHLMANQGLPLSILKVLDLHQPSKRSALFCRYCLQRSLINLKNDEEIHALFSRLHNTDLKTSLHTFIRNNMGPWLAGLGPSDERDSLLLRIQTAEVALRGPK